MNLPKYRLPANKTDIAPNVFHQHCPARYLLEKISGKWSMLIIDALNDQRLRNGELKTNGRRYFSENAYSNIKRTRGYSHR